MRRVYEDSNGIWWMQDEEDRWQTKDVVEGPFFWGGWSPNMIAGKEASWPRRYWVDVTMQWIFEDGTE